MKKEDIPYDGEKLNFDQLPLSGYIMPELDVELEGHALQEGESCVVSVRLVDVYDPAYLKACAIERALVMGQWVEDLSVCSRAVLYDSLNSIANYIRWTATPSQRVWIAPREWDQEGWHYDNGNGVPWALSALEYDLSCEYQQRLSSEVGKPGWLSAFEFFNAKALSAEPIRALYRDMNRFRMRATTNGDSYPESISYWNSYDNYNYIFRGEDNYGCFYGIKCWKQGYDSTGEYTYYTAMFQSLNWPWDNLIKNVPPLYWTFTKTTNVYVEYEYKITVGGYLVLKDMPSLYWTNTYYSSKFHAINILKEAEGIRFSPNINEVKEAVVDHPSLGESYWDRFKLKEILDKDGALAYSYMYVTVDVHSGYIFACPELLTSLEKFYD